MPGKNKINHGIRYLMDPRVVLLVLTGPGLDYDTETKPLALSPEFKSRGGGGLNSHFVVSNKIENKNSLHVLFRTEYRNMRKLRKEFYE